jgi:hypothetical protein
VCDLLHSSSATAATLLSLALVVFVPSSGGGQSLHAVLTGTVPDDSGRGVPGATVSAVNGATGVRHTVLSDSDGRYALLDLPAGTYDVKAELAGFSPHLRRGLVLHVGTTVTMDLGLTIAGLAESVVVESSAPQLETSKHTLARIVQADEIDTAPVINRNFNDLAALAPGVSKTGVYGGVDISGSRDFQNAYLVDGVSAERQRLGDQRMPFAQDWIQEFQVLTSQFNPEFGQASGGVVNVVTRSGGNQIAGRGYAFLRTDALEARPAFATRKPPLDEQRLGATLGGPVVKDRAFYFGGTEYLRSNTHGVVNSTFPAANGTFPSTDRQSLFLAKLDAVVSTAHRLRFRYSGQRERTVGSGIGGISTREHGRLLNVQANDVVGNWTWIVSPRTLSELRVAWSTSLPTGGCIFATENPPGTWFERSYPGAQFGCPVNVGTIGERQLHLVHNLSWTRGRHSVKLGVQAVRTRSYGDVRNFHDGRYVFARDVAFTIDDPDSYPFSFTRIEGRTVWDVSGWSTGLFAQDSVQLTSDVVLNLGVRYDVDGSLTALNPLVRTDRGLHVLDRDLDNVAPRAGVAWTPFHDDRRTLIRGGVGLYYDQNHNNVTTALLVNNILVDRVTSVNANNRLLNPFWPDIAAARRFLADALARNTVPDLSAIPGLVGSTNDVDQDLQIPATVQASGGVAREFAPWLNASADVVHARGFDRYVIRDVNLDPATLQRINPHYNAITSFGNGGWNRYTALQVQANAVWDARQLVKLAYTLATNRSNTTATLSTGVATNPFDYGEDEGPADNDVRHTVALNGWATMPFGLEVSGIATYRSALPYSATTSAPRPDGKPFVFRPEPRNARRGDSALSLDARLAKTVTLAARRKASVFVEVFNLSNAVNYGEYNGIITSTAFMQPTTAGPKRRGQLGLRVDF